MLTTITAKERHRSARFSCSSERCSVGDDAFILYSLASKKLLQHWSQSPGGYLVALTLQRTVFCMRHYLTQYSRRVIHKRIARATIHYEHRDGNTSCPFSGDRGVCAQDGGVVIGKCRCYGLKQ